MRSIRFKLIFMYFILVFIVMIISGTFIIFSTQQEEVSKAQLEIQSFANLIEDQVINEYESDLNFQNGLNEFFKREFFSSSIQGSIINKDGRTIASTISSGENNEIYQHKTANIISALEGEASFNKTKNTLDINSSIEEWLTYTKPLFDESSQVEYVIYVQMDYSNINNTVIRITNTIGIAVVIALILATTLGGFLATTITNPIMLLTKKANLLAKGNLEQHLIVKSEDEIGQLTRSFNHMARELRKMVSEIENENNKLEIVLHHMTDGVVAFDEIGILIHANKEFYDLMNLEERYLIINLDYFLNCLDITKSEIKPNENTELTIDKNDKFINVIIIPYTDKNNYIEGVVVVLKDITKQRKLDDMRKEFVANVSHEIRTPITTIKSYTETLLDGALEDQELAIDFLNTINEASDRMKFLTDDLLELSRLDGGKLSFNFKKVNLYDILISSLKQNIITANKKNQMINFIKPPKKEMLIYADEDRIHQVLNNILSNAIKYSLEDTIITTQIKETKSNYIILIKDCGIGIPKEDLNHIFERFYRVDKARSRAMGGNGLGLSIAKEIMEEHNGDIKAYSVISEGTTMEIIFEKYLLDTKKINENIFNVKNLEYNINNINNLYDDDFGGYLDDDFDDLYS
ncbi:MAG: ATP-binding protein [bacterium]